MQENSPIPMDIDLEHYMSGAMQGILARFVTYREEFAVTDEEAQKYSEKEADEKSMKRASEWARKFCDQIAGIDASKTRATGRALQALFRAKEKISPELLKNDLIKRYGKAGELMYNIDIEQYTPEENPTGGIIMNNPSSKNIIDISNANVDKFIADAEKKALSIPTCAKEYVEMVRKNDDEGTRKFYDVWAQWRPEKVGGVDSIYRKKMDNCEKAENEKIWELRKIMPEYMNVIKKQDQRFNSAYDILRDKIISGENTEAELLKYANDFDDNVIELINSVRKIYDDLVALKVEIQKLSSISAAMVEEKYRRVRSNNQAPRLNPKLETKSVKWEDVEETSFN